MINKKKIVLIVILLISCFLLYYITKIPPKKANYHTEVYKINEGYGYSVFLDNQPLIIQTHIPAIANKKAFCTYEDALNTSNIVKNKLKARLNPSVTIDELKHIDVMFSCDTLP